MEITTVITVLAMIAIVAILQVILTDNESVVEGSATVPHATIEAELLFRVVLALPILLPLFLLCLPAGFLVGLFFYNRDSEND